jgi:acetyl esterase
VRVRIIRPQGARAALAFVEYPNSPEARYPTAIEQGYATAYYLTRKAMQWFWDAYTTDPAQRAEITASPNQASTEQVTALPPTTYLCVDEADVLRDE